MISKAKTIHRLGYLNVARALSHRWKLRWGYYAKSNTVHNISSDPVFALREFSLTRQRDIISDSYSNVVYQADQLLKGEFSLFFDQKYITELPPRWFMHEEYQAQLPWWTIKINQHPGHDIKLTWDISRFHWILTLSSAYRISNNQKYIHAINEWFSDWCFHNPINHSVNWVCAQECGIRLIHTLTAFNLIKDKLAITDTLIHFVISHCQRIELTLGYSTAQQNNHVTSEAASLYIGGSWLDSLPNKSSEIASSALRWKQQGQRLFEKSIIKLTLNDGGFSTYSVNYHRVVINTICIVEYWRLELSLPAFSTIVIEKYQSLAHWLYKLVDPDNGQAPNIGNNDGSNPFILQTLANYADFRPSVQLAYELLFHCCAYSPDRSINEAIENLNISSDTIHMGQKKRICEDLTDTGLIVIEPTFATNTRAFLKYPKNQFRPSQCDILHFDLWHRGKNILRDSGSYSYNPTLPESPRDLSSIAAHNTIQIDDLEPMKRISPFLFENWISLSGKSDITIHNDTINFSCYYDWFNGARHQRNVAFNRMRWKIDDIVTGAEKKITLRWHLSHDNWILDKNILISDNIRITIDEMNSKNLEIKLQESYASRYYNRLDSIPVLVVTTFEKNIHLTTTIVLKD